MMTMRLTPAAGAATLRFSVKEQSPKISAEAVAAVRRRASEVSVRMGRYVRRFMREVSRETRALAAAGWIPPARRRDRLRPLASA